MRPVVLLATFIVLAGCSDPAQPEEVDDSSDLPSSSSTTGPAVAVQPTVEVVPFTYDGNLGTFLHGCVFPVGQCTNTAVTESSEDLMMPRAGANLTALSFTVTWTAKTPATATLTVGSLVFEDCDDCNSTFFEERSGASPLQVDVSGVEVPMTDASSIHIYVYNRQGFVYDPSVPAYGLVSADEDYRIEGTATFLVPSA